MARVDRVGYERSVIEPRDIARLRNRALYCCEESRRYLGCRCGAMLEWRDDPHLPKRSQKTVYGASWPVYQPY